MDEDDFKQAIRLLHVWSAWCGPGNVENPAKDDPLYPGLHLPHQTPLLGAMAELLAKYPYVSQHPESQLPADLEHDHLDQMQLPTPRDLASDLRPAPGG